MRTIQKLKLGFVAVMAVVAVAAVFWLKNAWQDSSIVIGTDSEVNVSPTQIRHIKAIGEWEFLSVSAEEMVDTVRRGLLGNDELVRIYYGTLRLGLNMHQVEPGWIDSEGDSVRLILPKIGLLDRDFIDEARTKAFFESGNWTPKDRELLYRKAHRQMLSHCLTSENLNEARSNAEQQLTQMMRAMGYRRVRIEWQED